MKPKAVLAYCREKGIRSVDLRFADLDGRWRHITFPVAVLSEASFEEGFGHAIRLDTASENAPVHCILVPHSEANYLDPLTHQPSLVLLASVQDIVTREESPLDVRQLAIRAHRYLESSSVGEGLSIRTRFSFLIERGEGAELKPNSNSSESTYLACGVDDPEFDLRSQVADTALESGVLIDRHYCGHHLASEMVLKPAGLVECCDDLMMLRYLAAQHASKLQATLKLNELWMPSQWSILRQGEPILVGSSHRGLSDYGAHAIGGILKHADAIAAIALSNGSSNHYPWLRLCSDEIADAICRIAIASHNPRHRAIEITGVPATANPYLAFSTILMAMIDGIQNKTSPGSSLDMRRATFTETSQWQIGESSRVSPQALSRSLDNDRDFLCRGEVFSEELIDNICRRLEAQA